MDYRLPLGPDEIMGILPHRPPFLFVDSIVELEPGHRAVGTKLVRDDEWFLSGHFPGHPVMPGVIIIEAVAQVGAVGLLTQEEHQGKIPLFAGADKIRFKQQVRPGDELRMQVEIVRERGPVGWAEGKAFVGDTLVASGEIIFAARARGE